MNGSDRMCRNIGLVFDGWLSVGNGFGVRIWVPNPKFCGYG